MGIDSDAELRKILSKRHLVLRPLVDRPLTKPALVDDLSVSRSTVDRAIDELVSADFVEPTGDASRYRATPSGSVALEYFDRYVDATDQVRTSRAVLNALPVEATLDPVFLEGADLVSSTRTPDLALYPAIDLLPEATRMRGTAPVVFGEYFDIIGDRLLSGDFEMDLVLESELLESIRAAYDGAMESLSGFDSVTIRVTDAPLHYAIWIIDREADSTVAGVTVYDEGGIAGSLVNDEERATDWALGRYREAVAESTLVE